MTHEQSPNPIEHIDPDRGAAVKADKAYRDGKWLTWAVEGGQEVTPEAQAMLGGAYDDRALHDVGLDGTVAAEGKKRLPSDEEGQQQVLLVRWLHDRETAEDRLQNKLSERHEFYTSPAVRERARLLSKEPIEVPNDHDNVLCYFTGREVLDAHNDHLGAFSSSAEESFDPRGVVISTVVPEGKRLVIDNIPKGSKYDGYPYDEDNPLVRAQVQIYHNPEGYLVADKVVGDQIAKKRPVNLKPTPDGEAAEVDMDAPETRAMDSVWASNDRKQEFVDPMNPNSKTVQLITTTAAWVVDRGLYDQLEVTVFTPDDAGNNVMIDFGGSEHLPVEYGPIYVRLIDDNNKAIADQRYQ